MMTQWGFLVLIFLFASGLMLDAPQLRPRGISTITSPAKPTVIQLRPNLRPAKKPRKMLAEIGWGNPAMVQNG